MNKQIDTDRQISGDEIKKANKKLHNIEAGFYDILHGEIWNFYEQSKLKQDLQKIAEMIKKKPLNILDVGAGTGNLTLRFLEMGNIITAIDISEGMLEIIYAKIPKNYKDNIKLVSGDIDEFLLKTEQKFNVISFSSVLHHLPDYFYTLDLAISKLDNNGVIYITHEPLSGINKNNLNVNKINRVLGLIDFYLNKCILLKYSKLKLPDLDYSISDIHSDKGINTKEILVFLNEKNTREAYYKEYVTYKTGVVSIIGNFLSDFRFFKLIAQKEEI